MIASKHADGIDVDHDAALEIRTGCQRREHRLAHLPAVRALDQYLRAVFASKPAERRRRRPENSQPRHVRMRSQPLHQIAGVLTECLNAELR